MELDTTERPPWLTKNFLEETLRTREGLKDILVTDSAVHLAVGKGENYTSVLYRIGIKYRHEDSNKTGETRLIIKVLPPLEFMAKNLKESDSFGRETKIIGNLIPSMLRLYEEKLPDRKYQPLSAYFYDTELPHTLILEDLTTVGCKLADRQSQLDLEHCVIVMKGLAKFHAGSVALMSIDSTCLDIFKEEIGYVEKNREIMNGFMHTTVSALTGTIEKWEGFEKYSDKIKEVFSTLFDRMKVQVKPNPSSLSVLNHGDCWVNNMLFHYSEDKGEVDGVRFIDFQLARYGSPALDLQYFMFTSPKLQVRSEKMDYLLEVYHKELTESLRILGQDPEQYTLKQLKKDFEEKTFFGFMAACTVLTAVLVDPSDAVEMGNIKEDGTGIEVKDMLKPYSGPRFKETFQVLLPYFEKKGIL